MPTSKKIIGAAGWLTAALVLWGAVAYALEFIMRDPLAEKKLPLISQIGESFSENGIYLFSQAATTLKYAALGFLLGAAVGIILAVLMSLSGIAEKMVLPYLLFSQMIPILGLAPIIFGLFKSIDVSRVVISAYITFFPVSVSLLSGLKLVDTLSAKNGIGYVIIFTLYGGGTKGQFWPAIIISALSGVAGFIIISLAEYFAVPWNRNRKEWATRCRREPAKM